MIADSATGNGDFTADFLGIDLNAVRGIPELELNDFQRMRLQESLRGDAELNQVVDGVLQGATLAIEEGARGPSTPRAPGPIASVADRDALVTLHREEFLAHYHLALKYRGYVLHD